jgi:glycosyltransferase involved in cell wall biosynthesis
MQILLLTADFPPTRNSASHHMHDLYISLLKRGHSVDVCTQTMTDTNENIYFFNNRFKGSHKFKLRLFYEIMAPIVIYLKYLNLRRKKYDLIITYSPSIFWSSLISLLGKNKKTTKILILRDIFPEWLVDTKILKKQSLTYKFLHFFEKKLYKLHDIICSQSKIDSAYVDQLLGKKKQTQQIYSWYSINLSNPVMSNSFYNKKKYAVYLGNLSIAQDRDRYIKIIKKIALQNTSINFLFIGLKSADELYCKLIVEKCSNIIFLPSMQGKELEKLISNAEFGLYSLRQDFFTNNVPGKFVYYACVGLPSIGFLGHNPELEQLNSKREFGLLCHGENELSNIISNKQYLQVSRSKILKLSKELFSTDLVADKLIKLHEIKRLHDETKT